MPTLDYVYTDPDNDPANPVLDPDPECEWCNGTGWISNGVIMEKCGCAQALADAHEEFLDMDPYYYEDSDD